LILKFTRGGKTYVCAVGAPADGQPPEHLAIAFRPCAFKAPFMLDLSYVGRDAVRGIELYQPVYTDDAPEDD
jgi:hypothetical protein